MRIQSPIARFATAIGLSLAVTVVLYATIQANSGTAHAEVGPKTQVVVAKSHLTANAKIALGDLAVEQLPAALVPPGALHEPSQALGRVTRQEIYPAETLLDAKMYPQGQDFSTVLPVPKGKRAVTVAVNEVVGVAGFVSVGSIVDVVATMDIDQKPVSRIILQNIQVLAAAQNPQRDDKPEAKVVSSVTLAVTPEQAEQLTLATEKGTIRLAMRSPNESGEVKTEALTPRELVGFESGRAAPAVPVHTVYKVVHAPVPHLPAAVAPEDPGIMLIRGTSTTYVRR